MLDPTAGDPATRKSVVGIIDLFVDDFLEQLEQKWNNNSQRDSERISRWLRRLERCDRNKTKNSFG